jgi:N-acetylmuramoyl-L-alanine amidase
MKIVISSGHGKYVRGASGYIDEVDEARKVVNRTAQILQEKGVTVTTYHDDVSRSQNENLNRIVDFHNSKDRDLDVSVHFNANQTTNAPVGCEVLYVSNSGFDVAASVVDEICIASGLKNRGPKERGDLFFLNNTEETAILIETCFVDSRADVDIYHAKFEQICGAIASMLAGGEEPEPEGVLLHVKGPCSWFGGPNDKGVSSSEGLAFLYKLEDAPHLFLSEQPPGTTGLARRLDPATFYVACRWDYDRTPKEMLRDQKRKALVRADGLEFIAYPADWGPHEDTDRVADLSPGLMEALNLDTDDEVEIIYPAPQEY